MLSIFNRARKQWHEEFHAKIAFYAYNPEEYFKKFDMLDKIDQKRWLTVYNACINHNLNCKYKPTYIRIEEVEEDA